MDKDFNDLADLCEEMSSLFAGGADLDKIEHTLNMLEGVAKNLGLDLTTTPEKNNEELR